jgi:hypothetical protein
MQDLKIIDAESPGEIGERIEEAKDALCANAKDLHLKIPPLFWYRGCARETYTLVPSLLRLDKGLDIEQQLLDAYTAWKSLPKEDSHWRALFEMQHWSLPTRLLDWTDDADVAKYFALSADDPSNPSIFVLHTGILNRCALGREYPPFRVATSEEFCYPKNYGREPTGPRPGIHELPVAILPDVRGLARERIDAQNGKFTVHGTRSSPVDSVEALCSKAVVKIVLRGRISEAQRTAQRLKTKQFFPDETGWVATQRELFPLKPSPQKRIKEHLISMWEDYCNKGVLLPGISRCRLDETYIERPEKSRQLADWMKNRSSRVCVIIGGAGSGKTNFLISSALKGERYKFPILYVSLNVLRLAERGLLLCIADDLNDRFPDKRVDASVLENMIRDGEIILMLDGLDELNRNQGVGCVKALKIALDQLADHRSPKIIIACRDHIFSWLGGEGVTFPVEAEKISLPSIENDEIKKKLKEHGCPVGICNNEKILKLAGEVPLLYDVIMNALVDGRSVAIGEINNEADCWGAWLRMAADTIFMYPLESVGDGSLAVDRLARKLGMIATAMLQKREDFITEVELKEADPTGTSGLPYLVERLAKEDCRVFVREIGGQFRVAAVAGDRHDADRWRFAHQAMREYTLAWNIGYGLRHPGDPSSIKITASFDYESAETYSCLRSLPQAGNGLDGVIDNLGIHFENVTGDDTEWNNFVRNYFEAIGMIGTEGRALQTVIKQSLGVLDRSIPGRKVRYRARFNAARCLMRLHSTAPPVYCVHITSPEFWSGKHAGVLVEGYAVRGFNRQTFEVNARPAELLPEWKPEYGLDPKRRLGESLENEASSTLLRVISSLSGEDDSHSHGPKISVCKPGATSFWRWLGAKSRYRASRCRNWRGDATASRISRSSFTLAPVARRPAAQSIVSLNTSDGVAFSDSFARTVGDWERASVEPRGTGHAAHSRDKGFEDI